MLPLKWVLTQVAMPVFHVRTRGVFRICSHIQEISELVLNYLCQLPTVPSNVLIYAPDSVARDELRD
jgi:hypothetical protein